MRNEISTKNIKPEIDTVNIKPESISSSRYAGYVSFSNSRRWGQFKWGTRKWGTTTEYSTGQKMPSVDTREV